ncbi:MAG: hypothetical protein ACTTHI_06085 [Prevotella sp.]
MKDINRFLKSLFLAMSCFAVVACSDENTPTNTKLEIEESNTFFNVEGGKKEVLLANSATKAYALDSWLHVQTDGKKVLLSAGLNTSTESRNTLLIIKNEQGDSVRLNVLQEGIYYGLPQDQKILEDDKAIERSMRVVSNVAMDYKATEDWIDVSYNNNILKVRVKENTTGKPRVGWITASLNAQALSANSIIGEQPTLKTDSLRVVQASIDDFVGTYSQTALTMDSLQQLIPINSVVKIEKVNETTANFIVDDTYTWEISFVKGVGFKMTNGKLGRVTQKTPKIKWYSLSVLVADDYRNGHTTAINGMHDVLPLTMNDNGELIFEDALGMNAERTFKSYGWNYYSTTKPDLGTLQGVDKVFIQPKLTRTN